MIGISRTKGNPEKKENLAGSCSGCSIDGGASITAAAVNYYLKVHLERRGTGSEILY